MNTYKRKKEKTYLRKINENNSKISKVAENILLEFDTNKEKEHNNNSNKMISKLVKIKLQKIRKTNWHQKPLHGYYEFKKLENVDKKLSWARLELGTLTSDVESYLTAIQEQEIYTKDRRKRNENKTDVQERE